MLKKTDLPLLVAELSGVEQLLSEIDPDAITSRFSLENRKRHLESKIVEARQYTNTSASVQIFFTGEPVIGTRAIEANFASSAVFMYQDLLTKATAVKRGRLGTRGVVANAAVEQSKLYLTGLAKGSFGFVLEEDSNSTPLFDTSLKDLVKEVSKEMQKFYSLEDDEYNSFIQEIDGRLFSAFKGLFKLLHSSKAQIKIHEENERYIFSEDNISIATQRVESTNVEDTVMTVPGILQGLLPIGGTFDFLSFNQTQYSGKVDKDFASEYRNQVEQGEFLLPGKTFMAEILKRVTSRGTGQPRTSYYLQSLIEQTAPRRTNLDTN